MNLTTPYQTFWLMATAEPNYAVVDPSPQVVMYSVKQGTASENRALPIQSDLFYFTHYAAYEAAAGDAPAGVPNQLLQAPKAVELASTSGVLVAERAGHARLKEEDYTREALTQAKSFLSRAGEAFARNPKDQEVVQFARMAAQSAENARALAMGAVGGLLIRRSKTRSPACGEISRAPRPACRRLRKIPCSSPPLNKSLQDRASPSPIRRPRSASSRRRPRRRRRRS